MSDKRKEGKEKRKYWEKRMSDKLDQGFKAALPYLQEVAEMGVFIGMDKNYFEGAIMQIGDGFNSMKDLIEGKKKPFLIGVRKKEDKKL